MATPQSYLYTVMGRHVHARWAEIAVSAKTLVDVLSGLGVAERTARVTFTRMLEREYLSRYRQGRRVYYGIGPKAASTIAVNEERLFQRPELPARIDGQWTLISFSIPERRRRDRQVLRVRLGWKGFGCLRDGLWIAPEERDVSDVIRELGLEQYTRIFIGKPQVDDVWDLVEEAWDLDQVREQHQTFLARWGNHRAAAWQYDALTTQILLVTEWRHLMRGLPEVPVTHLNEGSLTEQCYEAFLTRYDEVVDAACAKFDTILDGIDVDVEAVSGSKPTRDEVRNE